MKGCTVLGAALLALAPQAAGKVDSQSVNGFAVSFETDVAVPPDVAYAKFVTIGEWWSAEHTYSADSKNLSITPERGGCWCETLPNGGFVEHLSVTQVQPGQMLMFAGGLGPLAFMGVSGSLVVSFSPKDSGTHVRMSYSVGGYDPDGFTQLPAAVDGVLQEGFNRYAAFAVK